MHENTNEIFVFCYSLEQSNQSTFNSRLSLFVRESTTHTCFFNSYAICLMYINSMLDLPIRIKGKERNKRAIMLIE